MSKRLQYSDRKELMKTRNEGLSDSELKSKFGLKDDRTLKRLIRMGEQEEEARSVKAKIMEGALINHYDEIGNVLKMLQTTVRIPMIYEVSTETTQRKSIVESNVLFKSTKKHLPNASLWRNYSDWVNNLETFVNNYNHLKKDIEDKAEKWGAFRIVTNAFSIPIMMRLCKKADDQQYIHAFDKTITPLQLPDKTYIDMEMLGVDANNVLAAKDTQPYQSRYQELSDRVIRSTIGIQVINQYNNLKELGASIDTYLNAIIIRRDYITYDCDLCPGQMGSLRSIRESKHRKS
jgi:hypothetical protein